MLNFSIPTRRRKLITSSVKDRPAQSVAIPMTLISPGACTALGWVWASPGLPGTAPAAASKRARRGRAAWPSQRPGAHRGPGNIPPGWCPGGYSEKPLAEEADLSPALSSHGREGKCTLEHDLTPYIWFIRFYHYFPDIIKTRIMKTRIMKTFPLNLNIWIKRTGKCFKHLGSNCCYTGTMLSYIETFEMLQFTSSPTKPFDRSAKEQHGML